MNKEYTEKCVSQFNRTTLRKIYMYKSNEKRFLIRTFIIDRNSLNITLVEHVILEASLLTLICLYMTEFLDLSKLKFEDNIRGSVC